jgi:glycosyltransferase involved in cell wall biosynthesis
VNIVIDVSPAVYHRAGIGRFAQELAKTISTEAPEHQYTAFYNQPPGAMPSFDQGLGTWPRRTVPWADKPWRLRVLLAHYGHRSQDALVGDADVFHATDHLLPSLHRVASVFSLHDLTFLTTDTHTTLNKLFLRLSMGRFLARADAIVVPSEATKTDALRYFRLPMEKLHVIPYGVDQRFFGVDDGAVQVVRQRYRLPDAFVLSVGTIEPRKNLSRLLDTYLQLRAQGITMPLVLVGRKGWRSQEFLKRLEAAQLGQAVRLLGFVDDADLPALYAAATVFVYPSLYEGFGFPVLEAMAAGTPIVSSNAASLPEVVGDAGLLVSPYDIDGLAEAIKNIISRSDIRVPLGEAGRRQAQQFTWSATARATLRVYEAIAPNR